MCATGHFLEKVDGPRLLGIPEDIAYDLIAAHPNVPTFEDFAYSADVSERPIDDVADALIDDVDLSLTTADANVGVPMRVDDVWAAGVTYEISEQARKAESGMPEMYLDVYEAERPDVFFKATRDRVVGLCDPVGVRGDSE